MFILIGKGEPDVISQVKALRKFGPGDIIAVQGTDVLVTEFAVEFAYRHAYELRSVADRSQPNWASKREPGARVGDLQTISG